MFWDSAERGDGEEIEERLRHHATDQRWRIREAVALAMQRLANADPSRCQRVADSWGQDWHPLVQRAAVAALCEPRLLRTPYTAKHAVDLCACRAQRPKRSLS